MNQKQPEHETYEERMAEERPVFLLEQGAYEEWIDQRSLIPVAYEELLEEMAEKILANKLDCNEYERYREYYEYNYCGLDRNETLRDEDEIYEEICNSWSLIFIKS